MGNPPVPPNITRFLDHGLRDSGRWCVPLILRLGPEVSVDDVRAVLTAVTNHHDALRLRLVERAGIWEQHIAEPEEFTELAIRSLPDDVTPGSPGERDAISADPHRAFVGQWRLVARTIGRRVYRWCPRRSVPPRDRHLHHLAGDNASREILMTDIFTAFGQRLAGQPTSRYSRSRHDWREWSRRCAALATHPAVLESRDFWLDSDRQDDAAAQRQRHCRSATRRRSVETVRRC